MNLNDSEITKLILDNTTDIETLMTIEGVVLFESSSVKSVLGYEVGELVGKNVLELIHEDDLSGIKKLIGMGVANLGKDYRAHYRLRHKVEGFVEVESTAKVVKTDEFFGIVVSTRRCDQEDHVTEFKLRYEELTRLKLAVDCVADHVVITDTDGVITYANPAVEKITGFKRDEVLGTKAGKLWSTPMPLDFYKLLWKTIKEERKIFAGEITNKRKNGDLYFAMVKISPIVDGGNLVGFVGVETDITTEKKAIEREKTKSEQLEKLNALMVDRELKMVEMKKEIENLRYKSKV